MVESLNKVNSMKRLFLAAFALGVIGCANQPPPSPGPAVTGGYPYDRYARSPEAWGYVSPAYKNWTTTQLQKRRLDLYAQVPFTRNRNEVPAYIYSGMPLPQQDEIKALETELNARYQAGDKSAELKEFWPSSRRHIASGPRVESIF
jgi:hypothetical protein